MAMAGIPAVVAVGAAVAISFVERTSPQREPASMEPQAGVVVSYQYQELGSGPGGGGCTGGGVDAMVRLNNGELVQAASIGFVIVQDGVLVTVQRSQPLCGLATYTILHRGPPNNSSKRTREKPRAA